MKYVIGIDLGTSAVKILLVDQKGNVCMETSKSYPLIQEQFVHEWCQAPLNVFLIYDYGFILFEIGIYSLHYTWRGVDATS